MRLFRNTAVLVALLSLWPGLSVGQKLRPGENPPVNPKLPTLWIIGDSTIKNDHDTGYNGQWGWGHLIMSFFDPTKINVQNCAVGGTSSRSFQTRGFWEAVLPQIKPGDYLIMQFGHNDGGSLDDPRGARASIPGNGDETREIFNPMLIEHEVVHTYGWYLRQFVIQARAKGVAACVICSLIPRNNWSDGKVDARTQYPLWAAQAAKQVGADFLPLHKIISDRYEALGQEKVTDVYFPVGEHTHTDWAGAILNAQCVIEGLKQFSNCKPLVDDLLNPPPAIASLKPPSGRAR